MKHPAAPYAVQTAALMPLPGPQPDGGHEFSDRAGYPAGSSCCSHGQGRCELERFIDAGEGKLRGFIDGPDQIAVVCLEQTQTARLGRYQRASDVANPRAVSAEPASTFNHSVLRNAELLHR